MQDLDIFSLCTEEELEIFYLDSFISNNAYSTKLWKANPGEEIWKETARTKQKAIYKFTSWERMQ